MKALQLLNLILLLASNTCAYSIPTQTPFRQEALEDFFSTLGLLPELQNIANLFSGFNFTQAVVQDAAPNFQNIDAFLSVPQIVAKYGYPIEVHEVTTKDGYILNLHRIPHGKSSGPSANKPVVWLQHGFFGDSSVWITNDEDKALAYVLASLGYDVWMPNIRGNTYSRKHVNLSMIEPEFWQFSYHEMGIYDVPAVLEYILENTGQDDLHYIAHSMGGTMFFVAMSEHPELNSKIRLMSGLAPVASMDYSASPVMGIAPFINQIKLFLEFFGIHELLPASPLMDLLTQAACNVNSPTKDNCTAIIGLIGGPNPDQLNETLVPIIFGHIPAGTSLNTLVHYAQMINSKRFQRFDYGLEQNLIIYGTPEPPSYNLANVKAPVAIYYGENDWTVSPQDISQLAEKLPNLARKYRVKLDLYSHFDFTWAKDNDVLLNPELISFMQKY